MPDRLDRKLLTLLQSSNRMPLDWLAEEVGSSKSAVQRRLERFRRRGIIKADIAVLDPCRLDGLQTFLIRLDVRDEKANLLAAFKAMVQGLPEVQQCYLTTGRRNCVLIAMLPDEAALERFADAYLRDSPFVRRFHARLVTQGIKVGLAIPLEPSERD